MNKSTDRTANPQGSSTERNKGKSNQKMHSSMIYTRQIVIRTEEPDIPLITILKVQRQRENCTKSGFQSLSRVFERIRLKRLFQGLSQICYKSNSSKVSKIHISRLLNTIKNRQQKLIIQSWNKIHNLKFREKSKINSARLIAKLSGILVYRLKSFVYDKLKASIFSKVKRSITQSNSQSLKKIQEDHQLQLSKMKTLQYSEPFIIVCKKFIKINTKNLLVSFQTQLQPILLKQIQRYKQFKKAPNVQINKQIVLIVLNNHILAIKDLKKQLQQNLSTVKQMQEKEKMSNKNNTDISLYVKMEQQFQKADNQIRDSFQRHKKIQQKQLIRIVEDQLKIWNKSKENLLYNSRLFISAIIVKLIKDNDAVFSELLSKLQSFVRLPNELKNLQEFKRPLNKNERIQSIIIDIVNKFIDLINDTPKMMPPIMQRGFSENQEAFMSQIKYLKQQIKDYIKKFNSDTDRKKIKKTLSSKKSKAPQQLKQLYVVLNQLINLVNSNQNKQKIQESGKNSQIIIKIITTFKDCLKEGNYKKWQAFVTSLSKQENLKPIFLIFQSINDILVDKIKEENQNTKLQLDNLKLDYEKLKQSLKSKDQGKNKGKQENINKLKEENNKIKEQSLKIKQENNRLKSENNQIQKKLKIAENQKIQSKKQSSIVQQKDKIIKQKEKSLAQAQQKYKKLQKSLREKKQSPQKSLNEKQLTQLKKQLQDKVKNIAKLQAQIKKNLMENNQLKKYKQQNATTIETSQRKVKQLQTSLQKINNDMKKKNKQVIQYQNKIKILQSEIQNLKSQIRQHEIASSKKTNSQIIQAQYDQLVLDSKNWSQKFKQLQRKLEKTTAQLNAKQLQIQTMRNNLIKQQANQIKWQKSKAQYDALTRKINLMQNTIQNLKYELEKKTKQLQQNERTRRHQQSLGKFSLSKTETNVEHSLQLIKQLNKQLQKLKKSQVTLQQINKQLDHVHHRGQDVQDLISRIQIENRQLRKNLIEKDKFSYDLESNLNRLQSDYNILKMRFEKLETELQDKDYSIKRLEGSIHDRQLLMLQNQQNKNNYIRRLQQLIQQNESMISQLNIQLQRLRIQRQQTQTQTRYQKQLRQKGFQLSYAHERIKSLQLQLSQANNRLETEKQIWQTQIRKLDNQLQKWRNQNRKRELQKQNYLNQSRKWQLERQKLILQIKNTQRSSQKQQNIKRLQAQKQKYVSQKYSLQNQKVRLLNEIKNLQYQNQNLVITVQNGQVEHSKIKNEYKNWQTQRQKLLLESRNLQAQRQQWRNQKTKLQMQLKKLLSHHDQSVSENKKLIQQINQLNIMIQKLKQQISVFSIPQSSINVDNIILLLANITASFIRIHPKPNLTQNQRTAQKIFKDLTEIKNNCSNQQGEMFMNLQNYVVRFIENDIGRYRYQLKLRIDELSELKERLIQFLNNQIQISKKQLQYQYQFQIQKSTAQKTLYSTPIKFSDASSTLTMHLGEIKQKTTYAQKLFGTDIVKKY